MKTLNIYINGTDETNAVDRWSLTSLANVLHLLTVCDDNLNSHSICLEGCGVKNNDMRDFDAIFTFNLVKQIKQLENEIRDSIKSSKEKLRLNLYGFSRGGAGVFLLCQNLKDISSDELEINLVSFEPVPGNFITGVYADSFLGVNYTLSNMVYDLSECKNINDSLILFTNQPLPDFACHGPILPALPKSANSLTEVIPGCHKGAELFMVESGNVIRPYNNESAIAFYHVISFLQKNGTHFNFNNVSLSSELVYLTKDLDLTEKGLLNLKRLYNEVQSKYSNKKPTSRAMHFGNSIFTHSQQKHVNTFHQELEGVKVDSDSTMLSIQEKNPQPVSAGHRYIGYAIQLTMLLATALYFFNKYSNHSDDNLQEHDHFQNSI